MKDAGFRDFERGERGSTAEHLEPTQYKIQKDKERLAEIQKQIREEQVSYDQNHEIYKTYSEIDAIGKKTIAGKVSLTQDEHKTLTALAKEGIASRSIIRDLSKKQDYFRDRYYRASDALQRMEQKYYDLAEKCKPFLDAVKHFPDLAKDFSGKVHDLLDKKRELATEKQSQNRQSARLIKKHKHNQNLER